MKTSKPISTISYNTTDFLTAMLHKCLAERLISFWAFIEHHPEQDEKKPHKHIYIEPNGSIDTDRLRDYFVEPTPKSELPLACMPFRKSSFADWYLYCMHHKGYLLKKGLVRDYHYCKADFAVSDLDYFGELVATVPLGAYDRDNRLIELAEQNVPWLDVIRSGLLPLKDAYYYRNTYEALRADRRVGEQVEIGIAAEPQNTLSQRKKADSP